jgi:gas vesicle protein
MLEHIIIVFLIVIGGGVLETAIAQQQTTQPSVVWDEASKTWVSAATPAPPPVQPPQQQYIPPTIQQPTTTTTIPITTSNATVDLGTLAGIITPIIGAIAGIFLKTKKDMEKKDEEVKQSTVNMIEQAIIPKLQQIVPVAQQTAKQDTKINDIANLLYSIMGEKANEITNMPEIQQQKLLEDSIRSKIIAEQISKENKPQTTKTSTGPSLVWDEVKKEWVSK